MLALNGALVTVVTVDQCNYLKPISIELNDGILIAL